MGACFTWVSYCFIWVCCCFIWVSYGYLPHHTGASLTWVPHQSHTLKISRLFHEFGACPTIQVPNHIGSMSVSVNFTHSKSAACFHMAAWFISIMGVQVPTSHGYHINLRVSKSVWFGFKWVPSTWVLVSYGYPTTKVLTSHQLCHKALTSQKNQV